MKFLLFSFSLLFGINACKLAPVVEVHHPNKFYDSVIVQIHELKDRRKTIELVQYLLSKNMKHVSEAALALASIGDTTAVFELIQTYQSVEPPKDIEQLQQRIGFALFQSIKTFSYNDFDQLYKASLHNSSRKMILWTVGKSASFTMDTVLWRGYEKYKIDSEYKIGMLKAFYEYCARKHWSIDMIKTAIDLAKPTENKQQRILAASYLARLNRINDIKIEDAYLDDIEGIRTNLLILIKEEKDPLVKMNLALALQKFSRPDKTKLIIDELQKENDYRVIVALIQALDDRVYKDVRQVVASFIGNENEHIETEAAKFFANWGKLSDSTFYKEIYTKVKYWRAKNYLIKTRLTHRLNTQIKFDFLYEAIDNAPNEWARGELYEIMSGSFQFLDSLTSYYDNEENETAKTQCLDALCKTLIKFDDYLRKNPTYNTKRNSIIERILDALNHNDGYRVYTAANHLQNPVFEISKYQNYLNPIDNLLEIWSLPIYFETHLELQKLKKAIKGESTKDIKLPMPYNNPINWDYVKTIPNNQLLRISTEKGNILIQLDVENAPATVGYITQLAKSGFYNNLIWHRVVSNFVIQGGDPYGNGTGSAKGSLRSEHSLNEYTEGTVGIASAGKDTESCQFFITHNYTPNLNGRYSIIGYVVEGMNVVHQIQVNDKIIRVELL